MANRRSLWNSALMGAVAGCAATWLMDQATTWMYEKESDAVRERENRARGGESAYTRAADRLAQALGYDLSDEGRQRGGTAFHWATGMLGGVEYALLRHRWPEVASGFGVGFGLAFFMVMDELMNPLLGLTPGPRAFPWQAHARGAVGHVVYGITTEAALKAADCP